MQTQGEQPFDVYAKRQQLNNLEVSQGFVKAEVIEKTIKYQATVGTANMTLFVNDIELRIPQGTPVTYLAEFIGALS